MPSSSLFQARTFGAVADSTMKQSDTQSIGSRAHGFPARVSSSSVIGGDFTVATILVTPSAATVVALATQQCTALSKTSDGSALSDPPTSWATSDAAVATVSASGLVTAVAAGTCNITALQSTGSITSNACAITVPA